MTLKFTQGHWKMASLVLLVRINLVSALHSFQDIISLLYMTSMTLKSLSAWLWQLTLWATYDLLFVDNNNNNQICNTHTTTTTILWPGWGGTRRRNFLLLDFCRAREDNRGIHTDHPAWRHSIWTNQRPTSVIPHFYAGCSSCRNPPTLSWLGTGNKYAGWLTQWHG